VTSAEDLSASKREHQELYRVVIDLQKEDRLDVRSAERNRLNRRVDRLIKKLANLDTEAMSSEDYEWLSEALMRWQLLSTAVLKRPRLIEVPPPPKQYSHNQDSAPLTTEQVKIILESKALYQLRLRKARHLVEQVEQATENYISSGDEQVSDWHLGTVHFAHDVLQGQFPLWRLTPGSYQHLENVWLDEVKVLWAYFLWRQRGAPVFADSNADYYEACRQLRQRIEERRKFTAPPGRIQEMKLFLEREYLPEGKVLCPPVGRARQRIAAKASRLSFFRPPPATEDERKKGELQDWQTAEKYVQDFFEGVVQALTAQISSDDASSQAGVQRVFSALLNESLIDAFEAAITIYYLPA
jgi:hypothetical protein